MDLKVENDALREINQMALRSGRNLVKYAADSTELAGSSTTLKENTQTPVRKSIHSKRSIGKEKENEEPASDNILVEEPTSRKSNQRKVNKRKSKVEEEEEVAAETSPLVENEQAPNRKLSETKKRRKSMRIACEQPAETSPLIENEEAPNIKLSETKKRRKSMRIVYEKPAETSRLLENVETPNTQLNQTKRRRKSMQIECEQPAISSTSKENSQTPVRKSIHIKRSIGKEKENEEPATDNILVEEPTSRKSNPRKSNKRKSKLDEEEEVAATSPLVKNEQTPDRQLSERKKRRKSMQIVSEQLAETSPLVENEQSPIRKLSETKRRRMSMQIVCEQPAETSPLVENEQSPNRKLSETKKRRMSMQIVCEQTAIPCISGEELSDRKSSQPEISVWDQENEVATACISEENAAGRKSSEKKMSRRKSKWEELTEELGVSDIVLPSGECEVSSTHVIENVERNFELSAPITDQNEEDVAEILNSTFEVAEEDSILQTPARKRSVRFADSVQTRRQTAAFSNSVDNSPKIVTPVSVNSKQRSSQYKGTPHPSAKKRPASILKNSSSKKIPSSLKDNSMKGKGSARKMPDFSSIHKAQFEKMESIVDFSHRRHKCVRKLETQAVDDSNKQVQLKPSAVVKPMEQTTDLALSRISGAPKNTSRSGTPRALSISHIPVASSRVLMEKNFNAHLSTPHSINTRPSLTKMGSNFRPKPTSNTRPQRITYEQAKATIQNKKPMAAVKREAERLENRNILKGVRLNRRFELQMQHRKINM